jgi:hypothetical protein
VRDTRASVIGRFQEVLHELAAVIPGALLFATMSDDKVEAPNSDDASRVQHAARKLRELAATFTEASDRIQRARHQQKNDDRRRRGNRGKAPEIIRQNVAGTHVELENLGRVSAKLQEALGLIAPDTAPAIWQQTALCA